MSSNKQPAGKANASVIDMDSDSMCENNGKITSSSMDPTRHAGKFSSCLSNLKSCCKVCLILIFAVLAFTIFIMMSIYLCKMTHTEEAETGAYATLTENEPIGDDLPEIKNYSVNNDDVADPREAFEDNRWK